MAQDDSGEAAPNADVTLTSRRTATKVAKQTDRNAGSLRVTILLSVGTALITSLVAPLVIEYRKDAAILAQREKEKMDKIIATQFDIVERVNSVFWRYRQAAGFVIFDFTHGQSTDLVKKHLEDFEEVSAEANRELPTQAFRARMYFNSIGVHNTMSQIATTIFSGVDRDISNELLIEKSLPHISDERSRSAWAAIKSAMDMSMASCEKTLNNVFQQIGKTGNGDDIVFVDPEPRMGRPEIIR